MTHEDPRFFELVTAVREALAAGHGGRVQRGAAATAEERARRVPAAAAEAMEGYGVGVAAQNAGVPFLEIRAVSNPVGPRDRAAWRIGDALSALTEGFGKLAPVLEGWIQHDHP